MRNSTTTEGPKIIVLRSGFGVIRYSTATLLSYLGAIVKGVRPEPGSPASKQA